MFLGCIFLLKSDLLQDTQKCNNRGKREENRTLWTTKKLLRMACYVQKCKGKTMGAQKDFANICELLKTPWENLEMQESTKSSERTLTDIWISQSEKIRRAVRSNWKSRIVFCFQWIANIPPAPADRFGVWQFRRGSIQDLGQEARAHPKSGVYPCPCEGANARFAPTYSLGLVSFAKALRVHSHQTAVPVTNHCFSQSISAPVWSKKGNWANTVFVS